MKRSLLCLAVLGVASALGGCPIYPSSQNDYRVCNGVGCYDCPDPVYSSMCVPWSCASDGDCDPAYTCVAGQCVTPSAAPTDCSLTGCPAGQICRLAGGATSCVTVLEDASGGPAVDATAPGDASDASSEGAFTADALSTDGAAQDAAVADATGTHDAIADGVLSDAGSQPDASDGASPDVASQPCNANSDCGSAARCIDGQCTPVAQLCSDGTQCVAAGEACVDGVCTPRCSASTPCPAGYGCDFQAGVCALNPGACVGSCPGGAVCVESHCVPPCSSGGGIGAASDAGACPSGQACVNGGCIPDERAQFSCRNDGASGQLANTCDPASVCLHHSCYVACDGDGGGCPASSCKQVTVAAGTYAVCSTLTTLGSECDVAAAKPCMTSQICVDGYCKN